MLSARPNLSSYNFKYRKSLKPKPKCKFFFKISHSLRHYNCDKIRDVNFHLYLFGDEFGFIYSFC